MKKKLLAFLLSGAMVATLSPVSVFAAAADSDAVKAQELVEAQEIVDEMIDESVSSSADIEETGNPYLLTDNELLTPTEITEPEEKSYGSIDDTKFDLRDVVVKENGEDVHKNFVTSVKSQSPFGTCWGFSITSAVEASILGSYGMSFDKNAASFQEKQNAHDFTGSTNLDLSELQIAWFAKHALPASHPQGGEGIHYLEGYEDEAIEGGFMFFGTTAFGSGMGPAYEKDIPYQPKDPENHIIKNGDEPYCYSRPPADPEADWTVDESERFKIAGELEESSILPSPTTLTQGEDGVQHYTYNEEGTNAIKSELVKGRGVSIAFCADTSMPGKVHSSKYISGNWAHYTSVPDVANHAVTIVGWDDNYPKDNFLQGTTWDPEANDGEGADVYDPETGEPAVATPPENGAFLVKNSWGSVTEEFPHKDKWGVDGEGYFWLSYYDKSIMLPETFVFDMDNKTETDTIYVNQYDYLPAMGLETLSRHENKAKMANVFTAEDGDMTLRTVCTTTSAANCDVTYEIYRLNKNAKAPDDGQLLETINTTYEYGGYHREDLKNPQHFHKGEKFAVAVTQKVKGADGQDCYNVTAAYGTSKLYTDYMNKEAGEIKFKSYNQAVIHEGESKLGVKVGRDYTWLDWKDETDMFIEQQQGIYTMDNFPIKAYSDPYTFPSIAKGTAKLAKTTYTYDGTFKKPAVTLTVGGQALKQGTDYSVTYKNNKAAGKATAVITGIGEWGGTKTLTFTINPKAVTQKAPAAAKKAFTAKWNKSVAANASGYQVRYSVNKSMSGAKVKAVAGYGKTSFKVTGLKAGKKYYVQVRAYKTAGGTKYYSAWSAKKTVTTKK